MCGTFLNVCVCVCVHSYVMMMPFKRQALVEFSTVESADRCVSCGAKEPVYIAGLIPKTFHCQDFLIDRLAVHAGVSHTAYFIHVFIRPTGILQLLHFQEDHQADQCWQPKQWQQGSAAVHTEPPVSYHHGKHNISSCGGGVLLLTIGTVLPPNHGDDRLCTAYSSLTSVMVVISLGVIGVRWSTSVPQSCLFNLYNLDYVHHSALGPDHGYLCSRLLQWSSSRTSLFALNPLQQPVCSSVRLKGHMSLCHSLTNSVQPSE